MTGTVSRDFPHQSIVLLASLLALAASGCTAGACPVHTIPLAIRQTFSVSSADSVLSLPSPADLSIRKLVSVEPISQPLQRQHGERKRAAAADPHKRLHQYGLASKRDMEQQQYRRVS
jgi:hypothetical protein